MKKITYGVPEEIVPSKFCDGFNYKESPVKFNINSISFRETKRGCLLEFPLESDEAVYGFGLQLRGFNQKNRNLQLRVNSDPLENTGDSHAPVPFFVTTKGYGMYIDTARYIQVNCGFDKGDYETAKENSVLISNVDELYESRDLGYSSVMSIEIPSAKGVDIYIIEGNNITEIVSKYNMLSGGGCDVPEWGLGTIYRCCSEYTEAEIIELAKRFKDNNIECNVLGLEPGWQTSTYSCSYVWNEKRYPNYKSTVKTLIDMGYHVNLWEHAFVNACSPIYEELKNYSGDYRVWKGIVPDFASDEAMRVFSEYHKKCFVDIGIDGFKLDECDSGDYKGDWSFPNCSEFPSGMDGEQYHSMFGVLYMKTILKALGDVKTFSQVRNAGALSASYPFVLYSDLYNHKDFVRGTVNSGFSGILWTPELRDTKSKKELIRRLQTTVFSVQCLINAWYCEEAPWVEWDCEEEVKELLQIRKSLIPMLKRAFSVYKNTGKPPVRALVSDYTDDRETYNIDDEYIFCDNIIVAPITTEDDTRRVYLPEGKWVDFWTKKPVKSGWFDVSTDNIPVYEKAL